MALDGTAVGLIASVAEWLDDATLATSIPDFIVMAEARMNRMIRAFDQEARSDASATGQYLALPTDCAGIRSIMVTGSPNLPIDQMESGDMRRLYGTAVGKPQAYALSANQLQFAPVPDAPYPIEIVYYRRLPPLATNTTNWLLTSHPDCYLYGALMSAEMRGWNDERLPLLKSSFDTVMSEINMDSETRKWGAAPIYPRIRQNL